ncbi:DUF2786 domain-containing protein [Bailinhaonella thermotolerans]|uniref:DUF2786 domain-containing protein n=1 Tax=Bailinhaonella thermotolerans TaxID=1070861 RepID=UPI0011C34B14|nr:DUF2786 domain-containing protein [Bailinhaonella thermotolerans]
METADEKVLARVRALLAKAEATEFEAEAETFTAAAQALMTRHNLTRAALAGDDAGVRSRRLDVRRPYETPKASLLEAVARANRCRTVWNRPLGHSTVFGFPADLEAVEVLFTSLLLQAAAAMTRAGARRDASGRSRTRSFRHAFLGAYAARIGERLREASGEAVRQASADTGADLVPLLSGRERAVEEEIARRFPGLARRSARRVVNAEGWHAGIAAADRAVIDTHAGLPGS